MRIAVVGAGNVGSTLGAALAVKGHEVYFAVRNPDASKYQDLVQKVGAGTRANVVQKAVAGSQVVLLATPWPATEDALKMAGTLEGKVLLDCTNPLKPDLSGLAVGDESSGAEMIAGWAPGAKVFKVFNQTGFNIMANPVVDGRKSLMLFCGDDEASRPTERLS